MLLGSRIRVASSGLAAVALAAGGVVLANGPAAAVDSAEAAAHFVVLGPAGKLANTEKSVEQAGGEILVSWPQIGVVVAKSASADFAETVRALPDVQGAGASRALAELQASAQATAVAAGQGDRELEDVTVASKPAGTAGTAGTAAAAGDPLAANQWDLRMIKADKAHEESLGSRDVLVGVLDTGIEPTHPDLVANLDPANSVGCADEGVPDTSVDAWKGIAWDHGTHVAGTIAAAKDNGLGIAGVAPNVRIASVKVTDEDGYIYPEYAICGFIWAAEHGFDVTNNSYFVDPWYRWCNDDPDQKAGYDALRRAIDFAAKKDVVNVAALGNSNWDLSHDILDEGSPNNQEPISRLTDNSCSKLPAEVRGVVGVSSVGPKANKSFFSNYGISDTEVTAPGGDSRVAADTPDANGRVLSTVFNGGYGYKQGTSMASPHAAGVVALIRSAHPDWSASKVIGALLGQADKQACPANPYDPTGNGAWLAVCEGGAGGSGFYGAGMIDALDAVTK